MEILSAILLVLAYATFATSEKARFDNYRVVSVKIADENQRLILQQFDDASDSIDILSETNDGVVEVVVAPHKLADIHDIFERNAIQSEVIHTNLQSYVN